jgi:hypothetical protein
VNLLTDSEERSSIIEFDPASKAAGEQR